MRDRSNYFKLGLFVFFIMIAIVATIVIIGVGTFQKKPFYVETYFANSVQGLNIGSDVLFLGVPVGKVDALAFVDDYYDTEKSYIYVRISLAKDVISKRNSGKVTCAQVAATIAKMTSAGLHLKLVSQGITGMVVIEASYADRVNNIPVLAIDWEPQTPYVPSVPSIMTQITDSIESLVNMLKGDSVKDFGENILDMIANVDYIITYELTPTMKNIREATQEATFAISNINTIIETEIENNIDPILHNIKVSTEAIPQLIADINSLVITGNGVISKTDVLFTSQFGTFNDILQNVSDITSNVKNMSENASSYSSGILFSEPPPEVQTLFGKRLQEEKRAKQK